MCPPFHGRIADPWLASQWAEGAPPPRAIPLADVERNELNLERLKLDLLEQRTALALARVRLEYANAEYLRIFALRDDPSRIASISDLEVAKRDQGLASEEVKLLEETVRTTADGCGAGSSATWRRNRGSPVKEST